MLRWSERLIPEVTLMWSRDCVRRPRGWRVSTSRRSVEQGFWSEAPHLLEHVVEQVARPERRAALEDRVLGLRPAPSSAVGLARWWELRGSSRGAQWYEATGDWGRRARL